MRTKKNILLLLKNGLGIETISNLSESQVKILSEKFKKSETKEQSTTPQNTTAQSVTTTKYVVKPNSKTMINGVEIDTTGGKTTATPLKEKEKEITEKFESMAQQGLFWARCKKCSDKKCKWCKMAKEFSDSTSKKDYEKMPEKKHPEKTVKKKSDLEEELEDRIYEMLEKHLHPTMTKRDLINTILERSSKGKSPVMKKPIGKMFSMGKEMSEDDTKTKPKTKPDTDTDKGKDRKRRNPFRDPNPDVEEKPKADVKKQQNDFIKAIKTAMNI